MTNEEIVSYINTHFLKDGKIIKNSTQRKEHIPFFEELTRIFNLPVIQRKTKRKSIRSELIYNALNPGVSRICRYCKEKPVMFWNIKVGYAKVCSIECLRKDPEINSNRTKAIVKHCQDKYGPEVTNVMQVPETIEKISKTIEKRYGKKWISQTDEHQASYRKTSQERYGTDNPRQNKDVEARIQQQIFEKFGRKSPRPFFENRIKRKAEIEQWCNELQITVDGMQNFDKNVAMTDQIMTYTHSCGHSWQKDMTKRPLCEMCHKGSAVEHAVKEWLLSENVKFKRHDRTVIKPNELDLYFEEQIFALEIDGLYWHCDESRRSLLEKTENCEKVGVELMHIWENEWWDIYTQFKLKNLIKIRLGIAEKMDLSLLSVKKLSEDQERAFFDKYNLSGYVFSHKCFGLVDKSGKIYSAISILKTRNNENHQYKVLRYSSTAIIKDGLSTLMNRVACLLKEGESIIVEVDRRFSNGQEFLDAGFKFKNYSKPHYRWWNHRTFIEGGATMKKTMKILLGENYSPELSERENMHSIFFKRLTDCGNSRFVLTIS